MINKRQAQSLIDYNTFGIDVEASLLIEYSSVEELKKILETKDTLPSPILHIGGGSNLLFTKDFEGTILHSKIQGIRELEHTPDDVLIEVGAGVVWDDFVDYCVAHNYYGAENLSYIPGEVGASAVQNIGAYGVEVKDIIDKVETLYVPELSIRLFNEEECAYGYRRSLFKTPEHKGDYIITHVVFRLSKKESFKLDYGNVKQELAKLDCIDLAAVRNTIIQIRKDKLPDPKFQGNAGSFFMNPVVSADVFNRIAETYPKVPHYDMGMDLIKIPAGWLIDQCGWKGKSLGKAGVHDKQALVIVNNGNAQGKDIVDLANAIKASVKDKFDIDIYPEVNII